MTVPKIWMRLRITECDVIAHALEGGLVVSMKGHLVDRDELRTPAGHNMADREWAMRISSETWTGTLGGIGLASHIPPLNSPEYAHEEFFNLDLSTSPATVAAVIEMARSQPSYFTVSFEVEGLKYGWEPDGSGVEWDVFAQQHLAVVDAGFSARAIEPAAKTESSDSTWEGAGAAVAVAPVTPADPPAASKILSLLRVLTVIAGATLLVLLLK